MPGRRGRDEKTVTIQLRARPEQLARWKEYADWLGVSGLLRGAAELYVHQHPGKARDLHQLEQSGR